VAGLRFWARRTCHQRAPVSLGCAIDRKIVVPGRRALSSLRVNHREERVVIETDRLRITGVLHLPREGYRSRLTDYLNTSERAFLALTDVEVAALDGTSPVKRRAFLALSLRHVVLVMPAGGENASE
jgi:hypothetical protein